MNDMSGPARVVAERAVAAPRRRRVLIVASTLHTGGAERVIACLARNLDRDRFDVTVCYLKEGGVVADEISRDGTAVVPIPGLRLGKLDRLTALKLRRLIRSGRFELIHTHDMHGFMDGVACKVLVPGLRHVHTFHWGNYPQREPRYRFIENIIWRMPDQLVAVGRRQAEAIRDLYRVPQARLDVIWNGVSHTSPDIAKEMLAITRGSDVPVIGSISTLIEQKGITHLLQAARLLVDAGARFKLVIVGHGHLRAELEQLRDSLGLTGHVHFLGWITEASVRALPACDIFVQSSLWEAMSIVILEAMANSKPIVATRVGDNEHMLVDGQSGLLVPRADARALADALLGLLHDPALRARIGAAAHERHAQLFTTRHMIQAHEAMYERLLPGVS
jgi:glycosyltransferase involved in cell wall biosynthesis